MVESKEIPEHEQPCQSIMHEVHGTQKKYKPLKSLEEARAAEHGAVVIEGDWGGTIYLSCPVKYVNATQDELSALAEWLERAFWGCNFWTREGHTHIQGGHGVYYLDAPPGTGIWGGMGGGAHMDGLWVHPEVVEAYGDEIIKRLKLEKSEES